MGVLDLDIKGVYAYRPSTKKELINIINHLCEGATGTVDLNMIDVSGITDMSYMFANSEFNGDISKWDVSKVKYMSHIFYRSKFNKDISGWNVSNVEDMSGMFRESQFNGDISKWEVAEDANIHNMFNGCKRRKLPPWYQP